MYCVTSRMFTHLLNWGMSQNRFQNYTRNALDRNRLQNTEPFYKGYPPIPSKNTILRIVHSFSDSHLLHKSNMWIFFPLKVNFFGIAYGQADTQPASVLLQVFMCVCFCEICHFGHSLTGSQVKPGRSPCYVQNKINTDTDTEDTESHKNERSEKRLCIYVCMRLRVHIQGHPGCGGKAGLAIELTLAGRSLRWVIYEPPPPTLRL